MGKLDKFNKLKKLEKILMLFVVFLQFYFPFKVSGEEWPKVEGRWIKDGSGKNLVLKGVSIPDPEHLDTKNWDRPGMNTEKLIRKAVLQFKAKVVRIPVLPESSDGRTGYFANKEEYWEKHLGPALRLCHELKVYAIVDLHYEADFMEKKEKVLEFWREMSPKLKVYPRVIFEIFNEPTTPYDWNKWVEEVANPVVAEIRKVTPHHLIIVGGPRWNTLMTGALENPVKGQNIIYALHVYPNEWKSERWPNNYKGLVEKYPVFMTEWGYDGQDVDKKLHGTTSEYGVGLLNWMDKNQISWTLWNFDFRWGPSMFHSDWTLKGGESGMGELIEKALKGR